MPKPSKRPITALPGTALPTETTNPKENSEKLKIVKFLHFHFTLVQNPKKPQSPVIVIGAVFMDRVK
ncbi:hypothetical protein N9M90_01025 [Alphaproteobacteria bacterium]|nr:hypothetical protein [Alphaproteobacteria bacterium]